jgi:prevent-host-death family protein
MRQISVHKAKMRWSELLVEVEKGEQFVITRRGVAVARLVSAAPEATWAPQANTQGQAVADTFAALNALRAGISLDLPLREVMEQGRD